MSGGVCVLTHILKPTLPVSFRKSPQMNGPDQPVPENIEFEMITNFPKAPRLISCAVAVEALDY